MKAVEANPLYQSYTDVTAVRDLTSWVDPGEILGPSGPNGAGKRSTTKIFSGFYTASLTAGGASGCW